MENKVVILAAGKSSRFYPFNIRHKCFFKIGEQSILEYTIQDVLRSEPEEILIVLNKESADHSPELIQKVSEFPKTKIVYQKEPKGMADAILSVKEYLNKDFFVINAQYFNFSKIYKSFLQKNGKYLGIVGSTKTDQPEKYGILAFKDGEVCGMVEKPKSDAPSDMRVLGTYLFSPGFLDGISRAPISEYLLEDTINILAKDGKIGAVNLDDVSPTLKYPWDLLSIKDMLLKTINYKIDNHAVIEKSTVLKGNQITIEEGAKICDFAIIESPAYIGKNCIVGAYCQVRQGTVMEEESQIERYADVKNSIVGKRTHIHSGFVGDSVIGENVRIGAGFVSANKRLDRKLIKAVVKSEKTETDRTGLGVIIGDEVKIGINVSTMPGIIIGNGSVIGPNTSVNKNIENNSLFYTVFETTILKQ